MALSPYAVANTAYTHWCFDAGTTASNTTGGYWITGNTTATTSDYLVVGTRAWREWNAQQWLGQEQRQYNQRMAQYTNAGQGQYGGHLGPAMGQGVAPPPLTEEQLAQQHAAQVARVERERLLNEQARLDHLQRQREAAIAKRKAEALLLSVLTRAQRKERKDRGFFTEVIDGQEYRFHRGTHGNVHLIDDRGAIVQTYCIQPDDVPEGDAHVAQLMMLRHDRERFMRLAGIRNHDPMPAQRRAG